MTGTTWGLGLGALLTVVTGVSPQPWQELKTWALFTCRSLGIVMGIA